MFFTINALVASSLLASTALGHFTLDYPTSRGFEEDIETQFCGGFSNPGARQPFPLGKGPVWINSHHDTASVTAYLSTSSNPTSNNDFNATSNGTAIPKVTDWFKLSKPGQACWNIDLENLGIGLTNGSQVTLLIQYNGGDSNLFQCTDLTLLSNFTVPADKVCTSDAASGQSSGQSNDTSSQPTQSGPAPTSTKPSSAQSAYIISTMGLLGAVVAGALTGIL